MKKKDRTKMLLNHLKEFGISYILLVITLLTLLTYNAGLSIIMICLTILSIWSLYVDFKRQNFTDNEQDNKEDHRE